MFHDQADELRQLALKNAAVDSARQRSPAPLVVVAGGKGGVGTTTVAVNLAAALARDGHRTLLVDADLSGANATVMCGLDAPYGLLDVLSGRRDLHEILLPGPAGMQILPGAWPADAIPEFSPAAQDRLIGSLRNMGAHVDTVVLDAGNGLRSTTGRFWQVADTVLLVTEPDNVSVMDAYAAVKLLLPRGCPCPVKTVVNRAAGPSEAAEVHKRLALACQRFLGRRLTAAGQIEQDIFVTEAAIAQTPLVLHRPHSPAALAMTRLADSVAGRPLSNHTASPHAETLRSGGVMAAR